MPTCTVNNANRIRHLVNDGVQESPPTNTSAQSGPDPHDLFVDLLGANVGFRHWHPMPVSQNGGKLAGQSEMGGAWEWTSSSLEKHEGFEAMPLYPGYTGNKFLCVVHFANLLTNQQPTFSMASTTLCSVDPGQLIHASRAERACKST